MHCPLPSRPSPQLAKCSEEGTSWWWCSGEVERALMVAGLVLLRRRLQQRSSLKTSTFKFEFEVLAYWQNESFKSITGESVTQSRSPQMGLMYAAIPSASTGKAAREWESPQGWHASKAVAVCMLIHHHKASSLASHGVSAATRSLYIKCCVSLIVWKPNIDLLPDMC